MNDESPLKNTDKSYETAVGELEAILKQLETNTLPLEEAIQQFEQGVELVKHCQSILAETETKIKGLIPDDNNLAQNGK